MRNKKNFSTNAKKGVTLLELLVVITIIGVMTAVVIVSLSGSRSQKQVEVSAREMAAAIRELQNRAISGKQYGGNTCKYGFSVSGNGYTIGDNGSCESFARDLSEKNLTITMTPAGYFQFKAPHGKIYNSSDVLITTGDREIRISNGIDDYCVKVTPEGVVSEAQGNCP